MQKSSETFSGSRYLKKSKHLLTKHILAAALIAVSVFAVYFRAIEGPFILDDLVKIVDNPDIRRIENLPQRLIYPYSEYSYAARNDPSRPLVYLTYTLNHHFGKLEPSGYHIFDILLHIFNSILVYLLAFILFKSSARRRVFAGALFAGLLYALHPLMSNTVSYVFARSGQLSAFFILLGFIFFINQSSKNSLRDNILFILSLVFFAAALFSKQDSASTPALILLYLLIFRRREKILVYKHFFFWGVLGGWLLFRWRYFGGIGDLEGGVLRWGRLEYLLVQPFVILRYYLIILNPVSISFEHHITPVKGLSDILFIGPLIWHLFIIGGYLLILKRVSSSTRRILLFSAAFFYIFLLPTASILPTVAPLEEKRIYLPAAGFFIAAGWGIQLLYSSRAFKEFSLKKILIVIYPVFFILLGSMTFIRNEYFRNPMMVWEDVISRYPGHARAHNNLGILYHHHGYIRQALSAYTTSALLDPFSTSPVFNTGIIYEKGFNDFEKAIKYYERAYRMDKSFMRPRVRTANLLLWRGDKAEAEKIYREVIEVNSRKKNALTNLGLIYHLRAENESAEKYYLKALDIDPDCPETLSNLGVLNAQKGDYPKAREYFESVLRIRDRETDIENITILDNLEFSGGSLSP